MLFRYPKYRSKIIEDIDCHTVGIAKKIINLDQRFLFYVVKLDVLMEFVWFLGLEY